MERIQPAWVYHVHNAVALEPCAGRGSIIQAMDKYSLEWSPNELRLGLAGECERLTGHRTRVGKFQTWDPPYADLVMTNPPFSLAQEVLEWSLPRAKVVILLLRLNFLGSAKRCRLLQEHAPSVFVLPNRPSFTGKGTDSIEYAWFVWGLYSTPTVDVLDPTPRSVRLRK